MARSMADQRRRRRQVIAGILALTAAVGIAGLAAFLFLGSRDASIDPVTLCPVGGPRGHAVLLVDRTDPLNFTQKQALLQYLAEFGKSKLREGELFSVFVLGEDFTSNSQPVFEMCHPGRGEGKSEWTSNPDQIRRQFEEKFERPIVDLTTELQARQPARTSPIMEMLQLVAINGFRARGVSGPRRLYVVSDMLQNTPVYSQYRDSVDFANFRATELFQRARTDLSGVEVELAYLLTAPSHQTRRHVKFWEDYFQDLGARLVAVKVLEG